MDTTETSPQKYARRMTSTRGSISLSIGPDAVECTPLFDGSNLLLVIKPKTPILSLSAWVSANQVYVESLLHKHGGVLFRGFSMDGDESFKEFIQNSPFEAIDVDDFEESTPRQKVLDGVYTTTTFPSEEVIALHSDYTPSMTLAKKICFYCLQPSETGGETPFADNRRILERIDPEILSKFKKLGWRLVRNYGHGLGLSWQDTFYGKNKAQIEAHCLDKKIDVTWKGDYLRTEQTRSAVYLHPVTHEECWFNHISFWHVANLPEAVRESMLKHVGMDGLPFNTYYGDGSVIPDEVAHHLRDVLLAEKKKFTWQKADLLMADNILVSHGREAFSGPRVIRVALFEKFTRPEFFVSF